MAKELTFGEVKGWKRAIFQWENHRGELVCFADAAPFAQRMEDMKAYPDAKWCDHYSFDNDYGTFFACYSEDCFSPPITIVKGDVETVTEDFVENVKYAPTLSDADVKEREADGLADTVSYTGNGIAYDNETLKVVPVKLVRVEFGG